MSNSHQRRKQRATLARIQQQAGVQQIFAQIPNKTVSQPRHIAAAAYSFSGPLPPPEMLARYNDLFPGGAERLVKMAEGQHAHRQNLEARALDSNIKNERRGQIFGFIVALAIIAGGFYLIYAGKSLAGTSSIIAALASLVGVFVYGKHVQAKELSAKAAALRKKD